jgi:hypothetical protein
MDIDFTGLVKSKATDELILIFREWTKYAPGMVQAATAELQFREIDLSGYIAEKEDAIRQNEAYLSIGKKGNSMYLMLCFIMALLGGFLGIFAGYIYAYSKTKSYSGKLFYVYDEPTRKYGKNIFAVGLVICIIVVIVKLGKL